jgi:hypothetical protein
MTENVAIQTYYTAEYRMGTRHPIQRVIGYSVDCRLNERLDRNALDICFLSEEDLVYKNKFEHCLGIQERYRDNMWCYSFRCSNVSREPI